jgi:hypothetical protein
VRLSHAPHRLRALFPYSLSSVFAPFFDPSLSAPFAQGSLCVPPWRAVNPAKNTQSWFTLDWHTVRTGRLNLISLALPAHTPTLEPAKPSSYLCMCADLLFETGLAVGCRNGWVGQTGREYISQALGGGRLDSVIRRFNLLVAEMPHMSSPRAGRKGAARGKAQGQRRRGRRRRSAKAPYGIRRGSIPRRRGGTTHGRRSIPFTARAKDNARPPRRKVKRPRAKGLPRRPT